MGDERQQSLLRLLNDESTSLQGELVVGQLIETARSWAEQHNHPEVVAENLTFRSGHEPKQQAPWPWLTGIMAWHPARQQRVPWSTSTSQCCRRAACHLMHSEKTPSSLFPGCLQGSCAFCLLELASGLKDAGSDIRLPCFHSFHRSACSSNLSVVLGSQRVC